MNKKELTQVLEKHSLWLRDIELGMRANLQRADLRRADLRCANLQGADLEGAYLITTQEVNGELI
jgi:uncharacterized protein YjbI with pentapeptide repeats